MKFPYLYITFIASFLWLTNAEADSHVDVCQQLTTNHSEETYGFPVSFAEGTSEDSKRCARGIINRILSPDGQEEAKYPQWLITNFQHLQEIEVDTRWANWSREFTLKVAINIGLKATFLQPSMSSYLRWLKHETPSSEADVKRFPLSDQFSKEQFNDYVLEYRNNGCNVKDINIPKVAKDAEYDFEALSLLIEIIPIKILITSGLKVPLIGVSQSWYLRLNSETDYPATNALFEQIALRKDKKAATKEEAAAAAEEEAAAAAEEEAKAKAETETGTETGTETEPEPEPEPEHRRFR